MNLKLQKYILIFSVIVIAFTIIPFSVNASESDVGFSVRAIIPKNQIDPLKSYFDLKMKPGQKQVVKIEVFNSSSQEETIEMDVAFATTNRNGLIDYSEVDTKRKDESLQFPLTEIAKTENKEIVIPAGKSKIVPINISMPKQKYDGVILGAAHFKKKLKETNENSTSGVEIKNQYAYVVGIKLTETAKDVYPDLHLKYIKPKLINYRTAVVANIQNSEAVIVENMDVTAKIYKKGSTKHIYSSDKKDLNMAPNSNFEYPIDLKNDPLKPGTYRLKMKAIIGTQIWEWDEDFTIGKVANNLNEKALELNKSYLWWYIGGGMLLLLVLLFIIAKKVRMKSDRVQDK
ncbi:DUF916 and DUF3324 domain-containing protein [Gottfriedia solisilvae]|uniref:DUF3324 domain-containing protein n=1 Tax=Gottfriedia solisilvae TaxID=1516104 RepID=A0A8J3EZY6_9BACI|nr:DUF916 and DUF3324 domain-containing protein [Gottfriedia solisilvae]GGI11064.1 hypothetical protein GCM10007380_05950 [Gottfriedia solisilvae]